MLSLRVMSWRAVSLSVLVALLALATLAACDSEVTLHLLRDRDAVSGAGAGGTVGAGAAGEGGLDVGSLGGADSAGEAGSAGSAGERDVPLPEPCKKIGAEVCNGGDDDCNGIVDDECDLTVRWAPQPDGAALGHVTGGFSFTEPCAPGSVLVGLRVGMGKWLNQVAALCRQIELHQDVTDAGPAYSYTVGPWYDLSLAPANTTDDKNMVRDLSCPDDTVLTGVQGTVSEAVSRYVLAMRISCAPPLVTGPPGAEVLDSDRSREKWFGPHVCVDCSTTPEYDYSMTIPKGRVASRLFGGVGYWVDRVGFGSSRATIALN